MSLTRLILVCLMFYFIYRLLRSFISSFRNGYKQQGSRTSGSVKNNPKYRDIEDAKYVEIKSEQETPKQESVEKEK